MAVRSSVLIISVLLGIAAGVPVFETEAAAKVVLLDKEVTPLRFPPVLVDKVRNLEQSLVKLTAELDVYVLMLEDSNMNPPIEPLVNVIIKLTRLNGRIQPNEYSFDWVKMIQSRFENLLENPTAGLICSARAAEIGRLPSKVKEYFNSNYQYGAWWQIANDAGTSLAQFDDVTEIMIAQDIVERLDVVDLLVRFTRYALTKTGDVMCSSTDTDKVQVAQEKETVLQELMRSFQ